MKLKSISLIIVILLLTFPCMTQSATLQELSSELTKLINDASPAIVEVRAVKYTAANDIFSYDDLPEQIAAQVSKAAAQAAPSMIFKPSVGSGFVFDSNGYVMTTGQVVSNAENITVRFVDGNELNAKLISIDPLTDAAVLKIDKTGLKALEFGNSDLLEAGAIVVSINNMAGLINSSSLGIVSGIGRRVGWNGLGLIQISGTVGPGASGGPVLDPSGKVIGMTAAMFAPSPVTFLHSTPSISVKAGIDNGSGAPEINIKGSDSEDLRTTLNEILRAITIQADEAARITSSSGFAVPINNIKSVINDLKTGKEIKRAYLGAGISVENGKITLLIEPGSPADKAGVKSGDVLIKIDGRTFKYTGDIAGYIVDKKPGDVLTLVLGRAGKEEEVKVTLGNRSQSQLPTIDQQNGDAQRIIIGINRTNDGKTQVSIDMNNVAPSQVAQTLSDAYGKEVTISDPDKIKKKKVTASIKAPTIEMALDSVCMIMDCKYTKKGDSYIISPK